MNQGQTYHFGNGGPGTPTASRSAAGSGPIPPRGKSEALIPRHLAGAKAAGVAP